MRMEATATTKARNFFGRRTLPPWVPVRFFELASDVAQIFNLLYRRLVVGRPHAKSDAPGDSDTWRIENPRYSAARASRNQSCFLLPVRLVVLVAACPRCAVCIWLGPASKPQTRLGTRPLFG